MRSIAAVSLLLALSAPAATMTAAELSRSPAESALREMEARLAAAVAAKDKKAFQALWAEDAAIFPPGSPVVIGRDGILAEWDPILSNPEVSLTWSPEK